MRATRRGDQGDRPRRWRGLGIAVAVIALAGLTYPVVSTVFHSASRTSAVTVNSPDATSTSAEAGNTPSGQPSVTTVPGATPSATATSKGTATAAPKTAAAAKKSTSTQAKAGSASSTASLAGRIKPGQTRTGVATFYQGAQNTGACSFDPSTDHMTAAMNETDYEGSDACGAYIQVHGSNGATITVRVTNLCPSPCRVGQLDLDPEAYKLLAPLKTGETPITWKLVSPPLSGGIAVRYKTGSSQWWCGIQVINHRNPVARLEVKVSGAWKALPRASYNYFLSAQGSGCGGQVRVTDIYGQRLTVGPLPIKAEVTQSTSVQFAKH